MTINEICTGYINLNAYARMSRYTVYILVEKREERERMRAIDGTTGREMKLYGQLSAVFREN